MTDAGRAGFSHPDFLNWLDARIRAGESRVKIGRSLGVTGAAVNRWLSGAAGVSQTVLLLADRLQREQAGSWPGIDL